MRNHGQEGKPCDASTLWSGRSLFGALLVAVWCVSGAGIAGAADGSALFKANCAACHNVGGGPKVGPDLKDVVARRGKEGTIQVILDPAKAGVGPAMPKLGLTQSEAEAISAFLEGKETGGSAAAGKEPSTEAAKVAEAEATPQDISLGQSLFEGSVRLANGGPACSACHQVSDVAVTEGGVLAADLTQSFSRLGKEGFGAILAKTPFPVMQVAYEGKAINPDEARALASFLQRVGTENVAQQRVGYGWKMFFGGAGGVVVLAGLFSLIGWRRKKRCVNQDIYDRQAKSE